jgi:hypothetical protein
LEAADKIVRISHHEGFPFTGFAYDQVEPEVEDIAQVDVGKYWGCDSPLSKGIRYTKKRLQKPSIAAIISYLLVIIMQTKIFMGD